MVFNIHLEIVRSISLGGGARGTGIRGIRIGLVCGMNCMECALHAVLFSMRVGEIRQLCKLPEDGFLFFYKENT